ncbi:hybrid sensor histidine kinase/response regulator [Methylobacterium nonmethylotrophicum]|uniref:histidine kinase n=1 Tax=Methylobacterium nonmethylotrophicum TaxID=1141884 RepID=A0A4Z0NFM2_9HYPH|nr:PAS domain S-box protein [Methylobacterium nonmethylotrophicum]TGD94031.1 PAS domain S-box protein [Methylobacterium nonmethylotrophicum]
MDESADRINPDPFGPEGPDAVLLRAIIDFIPARVVFVDAAHRYRYVNKAFLAFVGLRPEEVIGRPVAEIVGEAIYRSYEPVMAQLAAGEMVWREGWFDYPAFGRRYVQEGLIPYRAGAVTGILAFARDFTELKAHEEELARQMAALRASEALGAAIVTSALDCIIVIDEEGCVVEFNPAAEATFGRTREAVLGRQIGDLIVPPHLRHRHAEGFRRYLATGQGTVIGQRIEIEGMRADGTVFPLELAITEVRLPERRLFTAYLRDLTAARRAAGEIEAQRQRLHQMEKLSAMGSLLAGVAHELNNPLAILIAQATLLRDKAPTADVQQRAARIHAAAERSGRIVKSFVAMARQKPPQREPADLNAIVCAAVEMTAYGRRSAGVSLDLGLEPDLPPILADRDLIGQVVANLLINAMQVLLDRQGERCITLRTLCEAGIVTLTVGDNGPGVPPALRERIFEPYFTTKPVGAGTGIGLSISRSVVESHDGRITVGDRPGGGALFRVDLPAHDAGPDRAGAAAPERAPGLSILVLDDEIDVARSLAEILDDMGHVTCVHDSAGEALAELGRQRFDAVFVDLRMPGLSGAEVRARIAESDPALATHTVIVTGDTVAGAGATRAGADPPIVIEKPFTPDDVREVLMRLRERRDDLEP